MDAVFRSIAKLFPERVFRRESSPIGAAASALVQIRPTAGGTAGQNTAAGTGLQLLSLNVLPDADSTINYVEVLGEVKNTGETLICYPQSDFSMVTAAPIRLSSAALRNASFAIGVTNVSPLALARPLPSVLPEARISALPATLRWMRAGTTTRDSGSSGTSQRFDRQ